MARFRPNSIALGGGGSRIFEIASSLLVTIGNPFKYHVFFSSDSFLSEYRPKTDSIPGAWDGFIGTKLKELHKDSNQPIPQVTEVLKNPVVAELFFGEFLKEELVNNLYSELNQDFFWHPGDYKMNLYVQCAKPNHSATKSWLFSLTEKDVKKLRLDNISLFRELCGFPVFYSYVYPKYSEK